MKRITYVNSLSVKDSSGWSTNTRKYMIHSAEAVTLTNTLLLTVRLQRHLGARIIISTQEPTISLELLDLSSITIVHRLTLPEWLRSLHGHLTSVAYDMLDLEMEGDRHDAGPGIQTDCQGKDRTAKIFSGIVRLRIGKALLFAPSAVIYQNITSDDKIPKSLGRDS
jgi:hypothetical protein